MVALREWDELSVALRLARRRGEAAVHVAEKMIRKWAESDAPCAATAAVRWVRIKAILHQVCAPAEGVH